MDICFHAFDMPFMILCKGEEAKEVIIKMFSPKKQINPIKERLICSIINHH